MALKLLSRLKIQYVAIAAIFLCFILVNADKINDTDMWWHLKVGQYIFENQTIPKADFYSFSNSGHPWIAHEWGSELMYYLSYKAWKFRGLFTVNLLFLSLTFFVLGRLVYIRANKDLSITTVILIVSTVFSSVFWVFRPHLLTYLFIIGYIFVLEMYYRGKNYLWILPPAMVLWVNMHGSFIMGIVLICIYLFSGLFSINAGRLVSERWSRDQLRALGLTLIFTLSAVLVNPNTTKMFYYPFFTMNSQAIIENIAEWSSPDFHHPVFKAFLAYLFLVYATLIISKKKVILRDILMLGLVTYLAMFGVRNISLFVFITGPIWVDHLSGFFPGKRPQKQVLAINWLVLGVVLFYGAFAFPPQGAIDERVNKEVFPYDAVEYMKTNGLNGTLFNDYMWGGYLIWTRYPANKIFIDGRADIYEDKVFPEYMQIIKLRPDAYDLLLRYNPRYIMLPPEAPLNHLIKAKGDWKVIYQDNVALIYSKSG